MADAMTTTASLDFDQTMWDRAVYYSLRPQLHFDMFATVKSTDAAPDQGSALTFTTVTDMAVATTPISESVDIDAVALADTTVTLTLAEYANSVNTTFRARATSFSKVPLDKVVANAIGYNAGLSIDTLARDVLVAGSNVRYATGTGSAPAGRTTVTPANTLRATDVRRAYAELAGANVADFNGYYVAVIHPDVAFDLRSETGAAAWRDPHTYSQPTEIWNGEVGEFEGFRFMQTPRASIISDAGSSTTLTDVYLTLFFGQEALAKAYSTFEGRGPLPITIPGPVVDKLKRFVPLSWHWYGKYGIFRQAAIRRVESSSSIGTNS